MASQRLWLVVGYSYAGTGGAIRSTWVVGRFKEYGRAVGVARLLTAWIDAQGLGLSAANRVSLAKYRVLSSAFYSLRAEDKLDDRANPGPGGIVYRTWELPRDHDTDTLTDEALAAQIAEWSTKAGEMHTALLTEFPDDPNEGSPDCCEEEQYPDESGQDGR